MDLISMLVLPRNYVPVFGILPCVFIFLWALIVIDFKNFKDSKKSYTIFSAEDPVKCYTNYKKSETS